MLAYIQWKPLQQALAIPEGHVVSPPGAEESAEDRVENVVAITKAGEKLSGLCRLTVRNGCNNVPHAAVMDTNKSGG
jgi:hypothetical protein